MIRVLVVDDSGIYRKMLTRALQQCEQVEVVGEAANGLEALEQIPELKPDILTLDMNMPCMDGTETLAVLAARHPEIRTIIVAAETRNDAERAAMVLEAGAVDMVLKPNASVSTPMQALSKDLCPKIIAAAGRLQQTPVRIAPRKPIRTSGFRPDIVAIGSSTGGPAALHEVLTALPADFSSPIVVVQHMPKLFIESLATRLDRDIQMQCRVASDGELLQAGSVYFAPGECHLNIESGNGKRLHARLHDGPAEHHCKPAVDVTFRALARLAPAVKTVAVVLTGMGADGAAGAKLLADKHGRVIAQDQNSSVVWGMPGETVKLGAADEVLPLPEIGPAITRLAGTLKS